MDFDVQIAHSLEEAGQEAWDRLSGGRPFANYRWYRFGETVLSDCTPIYVILSRQGEPLARSTLWLTPREPLPIPSAAVRRLMETLLRRWPLLLCRSPLTSLSGLILPEPPLRDAALQAIATAAQEEMHHRKSSFLLFAHLTGPETRHTGWPASFTPLSVSGPGTRLVMTWADFEGYLHHLSKPARKDYRRHRNRAADLGIQVKRQSITAPLESAVVDQAMALIHNVDRHHNSPSHPWGQAILENAHMVDNVWLTAEIGGRLAGCGLLLGDGDMRFLTLLGLDYAVEYAYFQLVYEAIRCTIEDGIQVLRGGSGAYEIKQRLGFRLEDNHHVVFASKGSLFQRLGRWAAAMGADEDAETTEPA
jgi:predicted N-acyltransferase